MTNSDFHAYYLYNRLQQNPKILHGLGVWAQKISYLEQENRAFSQKWIFEGKFEPRAMHVHKFFCKIEKIWSNRIQKLCTKHKSSLLFLKHRLEKMVSISCMKHVTIKKKQFWWPKIPDIFLYKEQEVICGILPPIPINSCEDYTFEKDSFEHVKKYMML